MTSKIGIKATWPSGGIEVYTFDTQAQADAEIKRWQRRPEIAPKSWGYATAQENAEAQQGLEADLEEIMDRL